MEGEGAGDASVDAGTQDQGVNDLTTVYNGSVPCQGCGGWVSPVAVMYSGRECHDCRKKRHHRHVKRGMHHGR